MADPDIVTHMIKNINRPFQISCGLREGYNESAHTYNFSDARETIRKWIEKRVLEKQPVAVGTLLTGEFIYPWIEDGVVSSRFEQAIHYKGRVREDTADKEAVEMLTNLAKLMAVTFQQKRIHVEFCNEYWVVEI